MSLQVVAFVDESGSDRQRDPHAYLLAAALCEVDRLEGLRASLKTLRLPGQHKLHWRDEDTKRRLLITDTVGRLGLEHVVVVRSGLEGEKPERRRRLCLERLWCELQDLGVPQAVLESRGKADDRRDRTHLDTLRSRRLITADLRIDHLPGPADPMLWVPDAVCGAVSSHRTDDSTYYDMLASSIQLEVIDLDT